MERHGFIHDMLDVKVLILYVMSLVELPVTAQTIYELCLQDDCLSYMDVQQAIPQMVDTGHLQRVADGKFLITEKGRDTEQLTNDSIAFPVRHRAQAAVEALNRAAKREQFIQTEIRAQENGDYVVSMRLNDLHGQLMHLELTMPTRLQAKKVETAYRNNPELVYQAVIIGLVDDETEGT
ncbi:MAG: DUF4364 family protein [Oscillospiraceae bacterium]|nr:DUF4364 family protein [Oscillospiraceae bacterium]